MTTITYKVIDANGVEIASKPDRQEAIAEAVADVKAWETMLIRHQFPLRLIKIEHIEFTIQKFERNQIS